MKPLAAPDTTPPEPPGLPDAQRILRSSTPEAILGRVSPEAIIAKIVRDAQGR